MELLQQLNDNNLMELFNLNNTRVQQQIILKLKKIHQKLMEMVLFMDLVIMKIIILKQFFG